jgi:hypothetical protein
MPCQIVTGYTIDCRESVGGVETIWVIENSNLYDASGNSTVTSASGTVSALNKASGKKFYKIQVPRGTASTSNAITSSVENGTIFYTHQVMFPVNSRSATVRNLVNTLAKNRCTFVTKEMDNTYRMFGVEFGLTLTTTESGSGTASGDRNGYMMTFSSDEREDFLVVPANIAATLENNGTA